MRRIGSFLLAPAFLCGILAAGEESTAILIKKLESGHYKKRDPAIEELVRIGPPAVPALLEALNHKSWLVREGAVVVLGRLKEPRAIPAMMANLKLESWNSLHRASIKALQQMGPAATPDLIEALTGAEKAVRYGAALALEGIQDERVVPGLLAALRHPDPQVVRYAALALGKRRDAEAVEPLLEMLGEGDVAARTAAVAVLRATREPRAVAPLAALLRSPDDGLREAAAQALGNYETAESLTALEANKDVPAAARVLKSVDTRGKTPMRGNGMEMYLMGVERTADYPGLLLECPGKAPCEFAEVHVRAKNLERREPGLVVVGAISDTRGKRHGQVRAPILDLSDPGDVQSLDLLFRVPKDSTLRTLELLGATFDLTQ